MTVRELIDALLKFDPALPVYVDNNGDYNPAASVEMVKDLVPITRLDPPIPACVVIGWWKPEVNG